jgi:hypothetical protein
MVIPIMDGGRGNGAGAEAYVTAFAVFHVTESHTGNDAHTAHFVATATSIVTGGQGAGVPITTGMMRMIKLAE